MQFAQDDKIMKFSKSNQHSNFLHHVPLTLTTVPYIDFIVTEKTYFDLNVSPLKYDANLVFSPFAPRKIDFKTTAMYASFLLLKFPLIFNRNENKTARLATRKPFGHQQCLPDFPWDGEKYFQKFLQVVLNLP